MAPMVFEYCGRMSLACGLDGNPHVSDRFNPPARNGYHTHPHFELILHEAGHGSVCSINGQGQHFGRGMLEIWPPGIWHQRMVNAPVDLICLYFGAHAPLPPLLRKPVLVPNATRFVAELTMLMTVPPERSARLTESLNYLVSALVYRILDGLESNTPSASPALTPALLAHNYILTHFPNVGPLTAVACASGVSYDHLRHLFRRAYGMSMKQFLIRTQIDRAKAVLIGNPQFPLKRIAEICGFSSEPHFSMCFRAATGQSPGLFRRLQIRNHR
jgi:AraC-like DNA-binding protein